jgi:response regulator RpfG family c-di-GMP phosphodiesterase
MLSQIGCITLTPQLQQKIVARAELNETEQLELARHSATTANLLSRIPRLETVAEAIRLQNRRFDGQGAPDDGMVGKKLPPAARILKAVIDYQELASQNWQPEAILDLLKSREGAYDPVILLALEKAVACDSQRQRNWTLKEMNVEELQIGMTLAEDLHAISGLLILPKGHLISEMSYMRLVNFCAVGELHGKVKAAVPAA